MASATSPPASPDEPGAPDQSGIGDGSTEFAARLRLSVGRLARLLRRQDRSGLPLTLSAALATIGRRGSLTLGELAACEQVAPPTITRVVSKLEEQGLVRRRRDPEDGRVMRVELSARGRRTFEADRSRRVAWLAGQLDRLDADERARLEAAVTVLEKLTAVREAVQEGVEKGAGGAP